VSDLVQAIADARGDVAVLKRHGAVVPVEKVAAFIDSISEAAYPFTTFISESDAVIRSGHQAKWFRQRFADWEKQGFARVNPHKAKDRQYLLCIVPLRHDLDALRALTARARLSPEERRALEREADSFAIVHAGVDQEKSTASTTDQGMLLRWAHEQRK